MLPNPQRIIDLANAFYGSSILFAATDLGVFAQLQGAAEGMTVAEIATPLKLDDRGARLLLDGCVALGLLKKQGQRYLNTREAETFLIPGAAGDLSRAIRYNRDVYNAWGRLPAFVRTGEPVERPAIHLGDDLDRTRTFVLSMHGRALGIGRAVVPQLDLTGANRLFDVGGGPGTYSVLIARANPGLHCTVLDLPGVVSVAQELIAEQGMTERVATLPGDYHTTPFPDKQDVVLFFGMLHQESPEAITALFQKAYAALNPGGRVLIMDLMTDSTHTAPSFSALFAVNMALTTQNGWVFSDEELTKWLLQAGFADVVIRPLDPPMPHWLGSAVKR